MKLLELFAGSRSVGNVAESMGFEVFSLDIHPFDGIDLAKDILDVTVSEIPFVPDVIWASPPCTFFFGRVYRSSLEQGPHTKDRERGTWRQHCAKDTRYYRPFCKPKS